MKFSIKIFLFLSFTFINLLPAQFHKHQKENITNLNLNLRTNEVFESNKIFSFTYPQIKVTNSDVLKISVLKKYDSSKASNDFYQLKFVPKGVIKSTQVTCKYTDEHSTKANKELKYTIEVIPAKTAEEKSTLKPSDIKLAIINE